ncbi:DUF3099 domain-containing protein [Microlunatus elymi]|uniref:DUF3099 domain-containing protein n=1 Tax=Microlunatus elymi TaxID=2596828 RepID=UPI00143D21C7|nr:DUF3099 domain-containing protein [Microlunatus elymi]
MGAAHSARHEHANLITNAQPGASEDLKSRQIRYGLTMAFRVACFISMIWVPSPYRWFLLGAAVVLPYIAVIFANQADQRSDHSDFEKGAGEHRSIERGPRRQLDWAADPEEERERQEAEEQRRQAQAAGDGSERWTEAGAAEQPAADRFRSAEPHPWTTTGPPDDGSEPTDSDDGPTPRNHD